MQEGGEGRAVVFGYSTFERIEEGDSVFKTVQHGEHAHFHARIQLLAGVGYGGKLEG